MAGGRTSAAGRGGGHFPDVFLTGFGGLGADARAGAVAGGLGVDDDGVEGVLPGFRVVGP